MRFAFVNDNKIKKIEEHDDESTITDGHLYQFVKQLDEQTPYISVGFLWTGSTFLSDIPNVTPRQIRQALILSGVDMTIITNALNSLPEPTRSMAITEWEYSTAFIRHNPLVATVGYLLGWNSAQLDQLWIMAGKL